LPRDDDELWAAGPDDDDDGDRDAISERRILSWRQLSREADRRHWWQALWLDVCALRTRYGLPVRSRWWEDEIQVEALAALAAWVGRYDCGDWEDPPGKLTLLFELERIETLLRDGSDPFNPIRDRPSFDRHLEIHGGLDDGVWCERS
jgi:hypothetical protein